MSTSPDGRLAAASEVVPASTERPALLPFSLAAGLLITSGQVAARNGTLIAHGAVGDQVDLPMARLCARQCARNALSAVSEQLGSLSPIASVVRLTVYVASAADFEEQHRVADAASELVLEVFGARGAHARTAIGVRALPLGSPVEVDMILALR